jgi:hypothetical protein
MFCGIDRSTTWPDRLALPIVRDRAVQQQQQEEPQEKEDYRLDPYSLFISHERIAATEMFSLGRRRAWMFSLKESTMNRSTSIATRESGVNKSTSGENYKTVGTGMSCNTCSGNRPTGRRRLLNSRKYVGVHYYRRGDQPSVLTPTGRVRATDRDKRRNELNE